MLAEYKGISRINTNKALRILLDQEYIGSKYEKAYKLQGKGPRYYLTSKALKLLRNDPKLNDQRLTNMYKNKSLSDSFMEHNIEVFKDG